jgi:hypothetical protein
LRFDCLLQLVEVEDGLSLLLQGVDHALDLVDLVQLLLLSSLLLLEHWCSLLSVSVHPLYHTELSFELVRYCLLSHLPRPEIGDDLPPLVQSQLRTLAVLSATE